MVNLHHLLTNIKVYDMYFLSFIVHTRWKFFFFTKKTERNWVQKSLPCWIISRCWDFYLKGKSPKVPFHGITLSYRYFEVIWYFCQFSKKQNMITENYQLNRNEKFVDNAQECFAFLHIKAKFKFAVQWSWFLET